MASQAGSSDDGFTLIEVLVATCLLAVVALGLVDLLIRASIATMTSRRQTVGTALALERLDELRGLTWGVGSADAPTVASDLTTDLSGATSSKAGTGLGVSPPNALDSDIEGWVDYADEHGAWLGRRTPAPAGAVFVRRWSVAPLVSAPDARVLQVRVEARAIPAGAAQVRREVARFATIKVRTGE
jgi:prepilin-type N-terminal cleavage/methylation domain-containing protein